MSKPYKGFEPKWYLETPPAKSYRSIFKWGDPNFNKIPKENLYKLMKEIFHLTDDDFKNYDEPLGLEEVKLDKPCALSEKFLNKLPNNPGISTLIVDLKHCGLNPGDRPDFSTRGFGMFACLSLSCWGSDRSPASPPSEGRRMPLCGHGRNIWPMLAFRP